MLPHNTIKTSNTIITINNNIGPGALNLITGGFFFYLFGASNLKCIRRLELPCALSKAAWKKDNNP